MVKDSYSKMFIKILMVKNWNLAQGSTTKVVNPFKCAQILLLSVKVMFSKILNIMGNAHILKISI